MKLAPHPMNGHNNNDVKSLILSGYYLQSAQYQADATNQAARGCCKIGVKWKCLMSFSRRPGCKFSVMKF